MLLKIDLVDVFSFSEREFIFLRVERNNPAITHSYILLFLDNIFFNHNDGILIINRDPSFIIKLGFH